MNPYRCLKTKLLILYSNHRAVPILSSIPPSGIELSTNDLGSVLKAVFKASTKWYNIGLMLKVTVATLDRISSQFDDPTDRLRKMLKAWLETAAATTLTWKDIVDGLSDVTVGHSKLASEIEATYCSVAETGQAS